MENDLTFIDGVYPTKSRVVAQCIVMIVPENMLGEVPVEAGICITLELYDPDTIQKLSHTCISGHHARRDNDSRIGTLYGPMHIVCRFDCAGKELIWSSVRARRRNRSGLQAAVVRISQGQGSTGRSSFLRYSATKGGISEIELFTEFL